MLYFVVCTIMRRLIRIIKILGLYPIRLKGNRRVSHLFTTTSRRISKAFHVVADVTERLYSTCEIDSHADTCVAGKNCLVMRYTERVCDVMPYSDAYEPKKAVPIARVATGYTNNAGQNFILILNEVLYMPDLDHTLLNPN